MTRLYPPGGLDRGAAFPLAPLLPLEGVGGLGHRLQTPLRDGLAGVIGEAVGTLLNLLECPVHLLELPIELLPQGSVHLSGEHVLALVPRVELGILLFLAALPLV